MKMFKKSAVGGVGLAAGLVLGLAGVALSQDSPAPPSWDTLVRCASNPSDDARLSCYDTAMRAAGYAPKAEAVVQEHRKRFGLSIPQVNIIKHHNKEEGAQAAGTPEHAAAPPPAEIDQDKVEVVLDKVAIQGDGRLLFITEDGQIWEQIGQDAINTLPRPGQTITIRRGKIGGYFCDVNKYQAVRCTRLH